MKLLVLSFLMTQTLFASVVSGPSEINGGFFVRKGESVESHTVSINSGLCSGTLIAKNMVLTAAHCVKRGIQHIKFGTNSHATAVKRQIVAATIHADYDADSKFNTMFDVAVIAFKGNMPRGYKVVKMLPPNIKLKANDTALLAGYGRDFQNRGAGILKKVRLKLITATSDQLDTEMLFAQTRKNGVCFGDSGGPAFVIKGGRRYVAGISSRVGGEEMAPCDRFLISTKVSAYSKWINAAVNSLKQKI